MLQRIIWLTGIVCTVGSLHAQEQKAIDGKDLFGDLKARQIGPAIMSGRITDIEGHPKDSRVVYIGTAGGGVWKSYDGGVMFNSIFDEYCQSIGCVSIDPNDPDNTVWVGTGETWTRNSVSIGDGIYKTGDGGKTWKKMGLENTERIAAIRVHPQNKQVIYAASMGSLWGDNENRGVYQSTDGGASWNKILYVNATTGCSDLVMDPNDPNVLYASFWEFRRTAWSFNSGGVNSALYKTTDGGKTWKKIHQGFPAGKLGRIAIAVAPSDHNILYAVIEAEKAEQKGLYRSDDAGATWKHLNKDFELTVRPFYFSRIVVDPRYPEIVAKAGLSGSISRDGGKTFKGLGGMHSDIHDIWFDIKDSDKLFSATDGGLYRSLNGGTTMEIIENLPVSQFYQATYDLRTPYQVYGGLQDNNSWYGPSASPGGIEARDWNKVGEGDGFRVFPHPGNPDVVYSEMQGAESIWRFDTKKQQLKVVKPYPVGNDPKLRFNWNPALLTSKHKPNRLYVGSQFLHVSDDSGDNWIKISPDLTTNDPAKQDQSASGGLSVDNSGAENHCTIFAIAESPLDINVLWVGTDDGNVQVTFDGGKNWSNVTANITGLPKNTWCYHIEASSFSKETAYAVFDGHSKNDMKPYVFKTTDGGKTWKALANAQLNTIVRNIQEDYKNPNLLFLGTEMGLYISIDGGTNWSKFTNGVPSVAVMDIELHPVTSDLILATHGRGIIILDDISPLRQLTAEVMSKPLHFFETKPFEMDEESGFSGTSSEVQFVGPNPAGGAKIVYYMSKRHTFGKMTMEIQDANGNWVTNLDPGKQKGINMVRWNYNMEAPKSPRGKTFSMSPAPRVPAGKYKVVIKKGSETFETWIEVIYDPNSPFTMAEREKQQQTTMKMYRMTEELAYLVNQIDAVIEFIPKASKDNAALKKQGDPLVAKLDKLKNTLVVTTGDNYVGTAEPQLREKMSDLMGNISSYYGAPSQTQLDNLKVLEERLMKAQQEFKAMQEGAIAKFKAAAEKAGQKWPEMQTFEQFVKKNQ